MGEAMGRYFEINEYEYKNLKRQSERSKVAIDFLKRGYISREGLYLILTGESLPEEGEQNGLPVPENE